MIVFADPQHCKISESLKDGTSENFGFSIMNVGRLSGPANDKKSSERFSICGQGPWKARITVDGAFSCLNSSNSPGIELEIHTKALEIQKVISGCLPLVRIQGSN